MKKEITEIVEIVPTVLKKGNAIHITSSEYGNYSLFSIQGKKLQKSAKKAKKHIIATGNLNKGIYIIQYKIDHQSKAIKVIVN